MSLRVFISYARESGHNQIVLNFWRFLRELGIDAVIDTAAAGERRDWALWMADEIRKADVVLCVASKRYKLRAQGGTTAAEGKGVQWEARLIRDAFYGHQDYLQKFVPVVLPGQTKDGVPDFLAPATCTVYKVENFTKEGAFNLLRFLWGRYQEKGASSGSSNPSSKTSPSSPGNRAATTKKKPKPWVRVGFFAVLLVIALVVAIKVINAADAHYLADLEHDGIPPEKRGDVLVYTMKGPSSSLLTTFSLPAATGTFRNIGSSAVTVSVNSECRNVGLSLQIIVDGNSIYDAKFTVHAEGAVRLVNGALPRFDEIESSIPERSGKIQVVAEAALDSNCILTLNLGDLGVVDSDTEWISELFS